MARFLKSMEAIAGKAPGDLVFIGNKKVDHPVIRIMSYSAEHLEEFETHNLEECSKFGGGESVTWVSVYGLHDSGLIQKIGEMYNIHPLVREDVVNTGQRPKVEEYDDSLYIVLKMLLFDQESDLVRGDQLSVVISGNFLISFHEKPIEIFQPVRERIRKGKGRIRSSGPDYLAYAMLDVIVDNYLMTIENIGSKIEDIEEMVLTNPDQEVLNQITKYKQEVNYLRKSVRPARELIIQLTKHDSECIQPETVPYWQDLQGLATQAAESLETYREMLSDHLNTYNTSVSNKLNEIMKILTIFAAIFIPLTFIAGIYGTNFEYLPELRFRYSYYVFWAIMITVAGFMIRFFKRKGWM